MLPYQDEFLALCLRYEALRFGEFKLKSGRVSPYFFNLGAMADGQALAAIGRAYAGLLCEHLQPPFMLYGPAYKGIPLVAVTALALAERHDLNCAYAFNRKTAKDHGEGGNLIGAPLEGRVVVLDDVITAGTSVRESAEIIAAQGAELSAVGIALDREERGPDGGSATREIANAYNIPVLPILRLAEVVSALKKDPAYVGHVPALRAYQAEWGVEIIDNG